jgi:hypothetical protein
VSSSGNSVAEWLESPEGEAWSRERHRAAHAGESHLPNHIASVRPAPGEDPVWDRAPSGRTFGPRDPEHDPTGWRLARRRQDRPARPGRSR